MKEKNIWFPFIFTVLKNFMKLIFQVNYDTTQTGANLFN